MFAILTYIMRKNFAILAIIIGAALLIWILYNTFIEMQPEYEPYSGAWYFNIGRALLFISVGFYWLRTKSGKIDENDINEEEEDEENYY